MNHYACAYKSSAEEVRARVSLHALLWLPLGALLFHLSLCVSPGGRRETRYVLTNFGWLREPASIDIRTNSSTIPVRRYLAKYRDIQKVSKMIYPLVIAMLASYSSLEANAECKDCITLGKKEKAMFRAHSGECLAESQVDPNVVESLLRGRLVDDPALRRHVYCVLVKCKVITKDGKLQKTALLAKLGSRTDGKNATKILENCVDQTGETPEDLAWNLFRCGFERRAVLFEYMPLGGAVDDNDAV